MSFQIILIVHVLLALSLVALVLMQHGKGADAGAAFGAGASGSVFGARGANSFMYKLTASVAIGFFATSLTLAYLATNETSADNDPTSIVEQSGLAPIPSDVPMIAPAAFESDISDIPN
ncbi:preprotein translocase subunit SecG [Candidatus Thioglobus sp.]|uniref:preprotein translocase subunit SecG n=1 Tax=Candidatus Thioglobus sp. TaxID=2026721 RepID=UPI003D0DCEED